MNNLRKIWLVINSREAEAIDFLLNEVEYPKSEIRIGLFKFSQKAWEWVPAEFKGRVLLRFKKKKAKVNRVAVIG